MASEMGYLITVARQAANWYEEHLAGHDSFIYCEDGFDFTIRWRAEQFPHLTGLTYRRADKKGIVSAEAFYRMLIQRQPLDFRRIEYSTRAAAYAVRKSHVILQALDLRNATVVYEITQGVFAIGIGNHMCCLGLVREPELSSDAREIWVPKSLYEGDIAVNSAARVTATHTIKEVVLR